MFTNDSYFANSYLVGEVMNQVSATVWRADFWLPHDLTWADLKTYNFRYPTFSDVWLYPTMLGLVLLVLDLWVLEPFVMGPLARAAGISNRRSPRPPHNSTLELLYQRHHKASPHLLKEAAQAAGTSVSKAGQWLRNRRKSDRVTEYDMFLTLGCTLFYNVVFFVGGWVATFDKPWVWNLTLCWKDYPNHPLESIMVWHYTLVIAYYYHIMLSETLRPRRKNEGRLKVVLHHVCTLLLLIFSWVCNFTRVGVVVLLIHQSADIPLLLAKMCKYSGRESHANALFACFLLTWLATRCYLYPFRVMRSVFFEATTYMFMPSAYVFMGLLTILLILNVLWTFLILRMVFRTFLSDGKLKEIHSSDEEDSDGSQTTKRD